MGVEVNGRQDRNRTGKVAGPFCRLSGIMKTERRDGRLVGPRNGRVAGSICRKGVIITAVACLCNEFGSWVIEGTESIAKRVWGGFLD